MGKPRFWRRPAGGRDCWGRTLPARDRYLRCEDCGRSPARVISFWATGMHYQVCQEHEREYCGTPQARRKAMGEGFSASVIPVGGYNAWEPTYDGHTPAKRRSQRVSA